jgi:hypothetical protein
MRKAWICYLLFYLVKCSIQGGQDTGYGYQQASTNDIQLLFKLAVSRPDKSHFVATIVRITPPATPEQIANELRYQKQILLKQDKRLAKTQEGKLDLARSNAIARAMSGNRVQHVEEWYSGQYSRLDEIDEGMSYDEFTKANPKMYHDTFVNIHDTNFYPYASLAINHELKDADVTKKPDKYFRISNKLWLAVGLEGEVGSPLRGILLDLKSFSLETLKSRNPQDSDTFQYLMRADPVNIQKLQGGLIRGWSIKSKPEQIDGMESVHFQLEGRYPAPEAPIPLSSILADYWVASIAGRSVCVQATITNTTLKNSFFTKRSHFDKEGLPHVWANATTKDGIANQFKVEFDVIDIHPNFEERAVFALQFPTNYFVSDMTSDRTVILQQPDSRSKIVDSPIPIVSKPLAANQKITIRLIFAGALLLPLIPIVFFAFKKPRIK